MRDETIRTVSARQAARGGFGFAGADRKAGIAAPQMLAAWAQLYRNGKIAAREVRAANRPLLGHVRS